MLSIVLPSKPRVIKEEGNTGSYEIDGLYPGYGHTLGNSLRRIILSSLPGAAITGVKITGAPHEFTTLEGVKEDVITLLLNLKRVRFSVATDEPQTITLRVKGPQEVIAAALECPGQVSVLTPDAHLASLTGKASSLELEARVERGLGFVPKETLQKERVEVGTIAMDAVFTPVRRVNYEVEHMRVGDRTDFNRLRFFIETDGTLAPREALEKAVQIMLEQLRAIVGWRAEAEVVPAPEKASAPKEPRRDIDPEILKTRTETLDLSPRVKVALGNAGIRTMGGLVRKKEEDILDIDGLGSKGIQEVKKLLGNFGIVLK